MKRLKQTRSLWRKCQLIHQGEGWIAGIFLSGLFLCRHYHCIEYTSLKMSTWTQHFLNSRHTSYLQWSEKWIERFYSMYAETFLALETSAQKITVRNSRILHPRSELGLLAGRTICKKEVVRFFRGSLFCVYLIKERHKKRTCGEGVIQMTAETFKSGRISYLRRRRKRRWLRIKS